MPRDPGEKALESLASRTNNPAVPADVNSSHGTRAVTTRTQHVPAPEPSGLRYGVWDAGSY